MATLVGRAQGATFSFFPAAPTPPQGSQTKFSFSTEDLKWEHMQLSLIFFQYKIEVKTELLIRGLGSALRTTHSHLQRENS